MAHKLTLTISDAKSIKKRGKLLKNNFLGGKPYWKIDRLYRLTDVSLYEKDGVGTVDGISGSISFDVKMSETARNILFP